MKVLLSALISSLLIAVELSTNARFAKKARKKLPKVDHAELSASLRSKKWDALWDMQVQEGPRKSNPFDEPWWKVENTTRFGQEGEKSWKLQTLFDIFPAPLENKTIEIYNRKAHRDLIESIVATKEINVCASGGSTTAGGGSGGGIPIPDRYYTRFAQYMSELGVLMNMNLAGHGSRVSLHTANWLPHFIPPDIDLLFWEFSQNDFSYTLDRTTGPGTEEEKNHLLSWLYAVQEMKPKPPKVILVYYWKTPFQKGEDGKYDHSVFDSHAKVAAEFDFVIGHINVASYLDELNKPNCTHFKECKTFIRDRHHPNKFGHLTTSYLMLNLLRGRGDWQVNASLGDAHAKATLLGERTKYTWNCGNETQEKRILQKYFTDSPTGWNSPVGSWTLEVPKVARIHSPKQLVMENKLETSLFGKVDVARQDRVFTIDLPFCTGDLKNDTAFRLVTQEGVTMKEVQNILIMSKNGGKISSLNVYLNNNNISAPGKIFQLGRHQWPCHWTFSSGPKKFVQAHWYIFDQVQQNVSSISACIAEGDSAPVMAIAVR